MLDPLKNFVFLGSIILFSWLSPPAISETAKYTITNVSSLTQLNFIPADINDKGELVGTVMYDPQWSSDTYLACLLDQDLNPKRIDPLKGKRDSAGRAINDQGLVVGESGSSDNSSNGFIWSETSGLQNIGTLGGNLTYVREINNRGFVLGRSQTADGDFHAFLWSGETGMSDLGDFGVDSFELADLNDHNQIVGYWRTGDDFNMNTMAFIWNKDRGRIDLGSLGGQSSGASAVNNRGQVVGASKTKSSGLFSEHAIIWDATGGMRDLGTLGGDLSGASSINNQGQIVGTSLVQGGIGAGRLILDFLMERDTSKKRKHAFIWEDGALTDLNDLIPKNSGWTLRGAIKITDSGLILGTGEFEGKQAYFLLTPLQRTSEPN